MKSSKSILIAKEEEKTRLDALLAKRFEEKSRNYIEYLFKEKMVFVNDKQAKKSALCKEGDRVDITFKELPDVKLTAEDIPLEILFEDNDIIICNKPAGMVSHPAPGAYSNTFAGALLFYLKTLPQSDDPLRPGIVHRLDKDTSGVIIGAKSTRALTALQQMFAERKVKKTYLAICHGTIPSCEVDAPIKRHPHKRKQMTVAADGKAALTKFVLLGKNKGYSLMQAHPYTGRTHQIRVHAKFKNAPIVGDDTYGGKKVEPVRHLLHAYQITFTHPFTEEKITATAPLPEDFSSFLTKLNISL